MPEGTKSTAPHCDLLVFDLDGTLIDSRRDLSNSVNATLAYMGRPELHDDRVSEFVGDGAAMLVRRALDATGGSDDTSQAAAIAFFLEYYREHKLDFTYAYPGVISELKRICEALPGLPMAILTNKPSRPSREICDGLGLSPFFFENYGGDSFPQKKPSPVGMHALIAEAAERTGHEVSPARTVLVGDSHVDVETARNAGTLCLGCSYGLDPVRLREARPDIIVDAPSKWLSGLQAILR